jgi:hypothetical protein
MLAWPLLVGFVLVSIAMPLQWLFSLQLNSDFLGLLSYRWLALALAVQALVGASMVVSWKVNLRLHGLLTATLSQCAVMIGLNSIGKYTPGKVLGIVARGTALYKLAGDGRLAVQTALVEQSAMLHCGATVATFAWLLSKGHPLYAFAFLPVAALSVFIASRSGGMMLKVLARLSKKIEVPPHIDSAFSKSYVAVFLMMVVVWVLSAVALYFCVAAYDYANVPDFWRLQWIVVMAYMAGFAAFFTLAGLGAREGIMLVMLGAHMDASVAAYIAILHRLLTLIVDLCLGAWALVHGRDFLAASTSSSSAAD